MKIAVPLFGNGVAPRFGFADQFLVTVVSKGEVEQSNTILVSDDTRWQDRLEQLKDHGVNVLLCGGFNRRFEPLAESLGIKVIAGLTGDALALAQAYARGERLNILCGCRGKKQNGHWFQNQCGRRKRGG